MDNFFLDHLKPLTIFCCLYSIWIKQFISAFSRDTSRGAASEISANSNSAAPKASFLDSMKSLYATISKAALSKVPQRPKTPNFSTDQGSNGTKSAPKRPPRKPRSQTSASDSHHRSMSSLNTMSKNSQSRTTLDGRTWDVHSHSSSTLPR